MRVIPCLDVDDGRVVKGVNFENLRDAGDPVELAAAYDAEGADELTFLDVTASSSGRATMLEVVRRTAEQVFIPLTVGGGVRTVADVDVLLRAGADKVSVNTAAIARPDLLAEMARQFGSQCIVLSVDARTVPAGSSRRRRRAGRSPPTADGAAPASTRSNGRPAVPNSGVGEILLNSMDADGTKAGFDLPMLRAVRGGGDGAGDRQRRRRCGGTFRARRCCRRRRGVGRQRVPLPGADHRPGEGGDGGRRDHGAMTLDPDIAARLKRNADGLFTAVVQERGSGDVLMVAWMDDEALARTLETREATYFSRSRGEQWVKGATSGHTQHVHSVRLDCDGDTVLLEVDQVGGGVPHRRPQLLRRRRAAGAGGVTEGRHQRVISDREIGLRNPPGAPLTVCWKQHPRATSRPTFRREKRRSRR